MNQDKAKARGQNKLWVPFVVLVGAVVGFLSFVLTRTGPGFERLPPFVRTPPFGEQLATYQILLEFHIILSTIGVALLIALLVVYTRIYLRTKANFIFGLLVVLFALLLQSILSSPLLLSAIEPFGIPPFFSYTIADVFMIVAYTVFLYLSLE